MRKVPLCYWFPHFKRRNLSPREISHVVWSLCSVSSWSLETVSKPFCKRGMLREKSILTHTLLSLGFPNSSVGKESACNAGDPSSILGSGRSAGGRSAGEGIGYPLQDSWASVVAQLVKNLPAVRGTWVWSLGWEDPLHKGKATHSSFWPREFHGQSMGLQRVGRDFHFCSPYCELQCLNLISQNCLGVHPQNKFSGKCSLPYPSYPHFPSDEHLTDTLIIILNSRGSKNNTVEKKINKFLAVVIAGIPITCVGYNSHAKFKSKLWHFCVTYFKNLKKIILFFRGRGAGKYITWLISR